MNKNNENQIKKGERYEFVLDNDEKYIGICVRGPFLNKIEGVCEAGFLCHKDNEKEDYDLSISLQKIRSIKIIKI